VTRIEEVLRRALRDLGDEGTSFALVGGLAVSARTIPRFTRDLDLAVAVPGDPEAEALVRALGVRGYRTFATVEQEAIGRLAQVRLVPPEEDEDGALLDLLFASSGIETEVVSSGEEMEVLPGLRVPVATLAHLLALKVLARDDENRPQDRSDLQALLAVSSPSDLEAAVAAAALIMERGFARGRDLVAAVRALRTTARS
jgi:hypothetical protein